MSTDIAKRLAEILQQEADIEAAERLHQSRVDWLAEIGGDGEPAAYRRFQEALAEVR